MTQKANEINLEEETFEALVHQTRRDILRFVGEKKSPGFTEIQTAAKIPDTPTLAYHLRSLNQFIKQENGRYQLTPIGKDAYSLLLRTTEVSSSLSFFKQKSHRVTFDNAVIWGAVIVATIVIGAPAVLVPILIGAAFVSSVTTYRLFDEAKTCL